MAIVSYFGFDRQVLERHTRDRGPCRLSIDHTFSHGHFQVALPRVEMFVRASSAVGYEGARGGPVLAELCTPDEGLAVRLAHRADGVIGVRKG